jgi:multiple sugar transport system permease protein
MSIRILGSRASTRQIAPPRSTGRRKPYYRPYVPYLFLLPGLALYLIWSVYPLLYQLYISFFDWKIIPGQTSTYVGWGIIRLSWPTKRSGWRCAIPPCTPP